MEQAELTHQKDAWQHIWKRRGFLTAIVDRGRTVYNWFFHRYLRKFITPHTRFLEVGCGSATLSISLAGEVRELVGIDNADSALELSRRNARERGANNCTFIQGDCLALPFHDEFDVVWSQGLMEHFDEPVKVAKEHYKAAKAGGIALLSVPYKYSYHTLWYKLTRPKFLRSLWPWTDQVFLDRDELLAIGRACTKDARVHFLRPFFLGIAILELPK